MVSNQTLGFIAKAKEESRDSLFPQNWEEFYQPESHKIMFSITVLELPDFFPFPTIQIELVKVFWNTLKSSQTLNQGQKQSQAKP